ncbi:unnamed protein product [Heligmosomoides polygyrus]|uniref:Nucleotidyltransferase n=1 Tax=Heligmosomoides polygyrus TaxID=6339 RepID=A0A183G0M9_HELPZ|nr:unnamed protein product [Heligmosomoides polygyrus]
MEAVEQQARVAREALRNALDELMELTQKPRTLAFSGQHNGLGAQAKWARIDTLDAHVLMTIARKKNSREASEPTTSSWDTVRKLGIDLDENVTRIPGVDAVVRNASGEVMSFLDTLATAVVVEGKTVRVPFHVGEGFDEMGILRTNALKLFNIKLAWIEEYDEHPSSSQRDAVKYAIVKERIFIPPHSSKS